MSQTPLCAPFLPAANEARSLTESSLSLHSLSCGRTPPLKLRRLQFGQGLITTSIQPCLIQPRPIPSSSIKTSPPRTLLATGFHRSYVSRVVPLLQHHLECLVTQSPEPEDEYQISFVLGSRTRGLALVTHHDSQHIAGEGYLAKAEYLP